MKGLLVFVLIVVGIWFWFSKPLGPLPEVSLPSHHETSVEGDCFEDTQRCLIVYVSPWCPACRKAKKLINEIYSEVLASDGRVGMKIIVGRDELEKLEKFADSFEPAVYLDPGDEFYRKAEVGGVPCWFVVDDKQMIQTVFRGVMTGPMPLVLEEMIENQLSLGEFL